MSDAAKWYVVHTYSGYENKVASSIEKRSKTASCMTDPSRQHPDREGR